MVCSSPFSLRKYLSRAFFHAIVVIIIIAVIVINYKDVFFSLYCLPVCHPAWQFVCTTVFAASSLFPHPQTKSSSPNPFSKSYFPPPTPTPHAPTFSTSTPRPFPVFLASSQTTTSLETRYPNHWVIHDSAQAHSMGDDSPSPPYPLHTRSNPLGRPILSTRRLHLSAAFWLGLLEDYRSHYHAVCQKLLGQDNRFGRRRSSVCRKDALGQAR